MARKTMQAVQYDRYGGGAAGLKHVEIPIPSPKKDEILIKVEAVSLNPADWRLQSGILRPFLPKRFPMTPGTDIAGEVIAVGSEVSTFKEGDKVVSMLSVSYAGGLAEYAVASACVTVMRSSQLSAAKSSGLGIAGLTALQAITSTGVKLDGTPHPIKNILITAASGGVGHYAVQLAKLANIHVTATCGARNLDVIKSLGADEVLDYKTPEGESLKSPSGKIYDAVVKCAQGTSFAKIDPNLSEDGKVADVAPDGGSFFTCVRQKLTFSRKKLVPVFTVKKVEDLRFLVGLAEEGKIRTLIDSKYPLSQAVDAWAKVLSGHATGKVVVEMSEEHN